MAAPIAVFDLDGTLVDTAPDLADTLNLILAREGLPPIPYDEARMMIGAGARAMLERGLRSRAHDLPQETTDRLFQDFIGHYAEHIADRSRLFPGAAVALDRLAQAGFALAVCTNKLEWLSKRLLDELGMGAKFAVVCGQDTFGVKKPDPLVLQRIIERAGADPRRTVMVGDSETDILLARAAQVPVVAVDFGYTPIPVARFAPDRVISHFDGLVPAIKGLPEFAGGHW